MISCIFTLAWLDLNCNSKVNGNRFLHTFFADKGLLVFAMQHIQTHDFPNVKNRGGGRIASDRYRETLQFCEDFAGLEENTNRYGLLLLVKRVGKLAGFTPRMIHLLDYYMAYTTELDWEQGSRPIVFQSLSRTALDFGVTERQIQKLEKQLFELGAITWNDSGNHKRFGQRDTATGRLLYAYGVDLTPLAYLKAELENKLHQKQLYNQAWQETKRDISSYRRQIRSLILEWQLEEGADLYQIQNFDQSYQEIAFQLRTHIELQELRSLLERHKSLHKVLIDAMGVGEDERNKMAARPSPMAQTTPKHSCTSEPEFVHYKYSNLNKNYCSPLDNSFQKNKEEIPAPNDPILAAGIPHITLKQVIHCASDRFREHFPIEPRPLNWNDVIEAAYRVRADLQISQQSWREACELLGRVGASVCVILVDRATRRSSNPVTQPAAYFRGMVRKSAHGDLRLHSAVMGVLKLQSMCKEGPC